VAISEDEELWAVYEPGAGQAFSFASGGALYICRLPTAVISVKWKPAEEIGTDGQQPADLDKLIVEPWPFLLDTLTLDVRSLRIKKERADLQPEGGRYILHAETDRCTFHWCVS